MRSATVIGFAFVAAVLSWLVLAGCAKPRRPVYAAPAPAAVSTTEVRRAVAATRTRTESARTRVETVVREIETIKEVVPAEIAGRLAAVQQELFKVTAELRDAHEQNAIAETQIAILETQSEAVRSWGISQQEIANANAEGWRKEEEERQRAVADRDKARAVANKRGNLVGVLGGSAAALLGLKFVTMAIPWTLALVPAGAVLGYFCARFIL